MIVVGVPNTNRGRDLTRPNARWAPPADGIGGPDKFLSFIGDALIPEIDRRYRTRSYRVIAEHLLLQERRHLVGAAQVLTANTSCKRCQ